MKKLSYLQSSTKVLAHFTILMKNEHCLNLSLPTPNTMLISIHATMLQYLNIVFGERVAWEFEFTNYGKYLSLGAYLSVMPRTFVEYCSLGDRSFSVAAPKLWSELSKRVRDCTYSGTLNLS